MLVEIDLPPKTMDFVEDEASLASMDVAAYLSRLVQDAADELRDLRTFEQENQGKIRQAVQRGMEQAAAGQIIPADDVFNELLSN